MFCPTCGKDNPHEQRFCAGCGTNLETVSMALSGREEDFFVRFDNGMDNFIARYADRVFKNAAAGSAENKVSRSWRLLGQAVVTTFVDILLFTLMWNFLPLRFLLLLISTPFRLLTERSHQRQIEAMSSAEGYQPPNLSESPAQLWLSESTPTVTESTTLDLRVAQRRVSSTRDLHE